MITLRETYLTEFDEEKLVIIISNVDFRMRSVERIYLSILILLTVQQPVHDYIEERSLSSPVNNVFSK
ncbi:MAG: hypothetical protein QXP72_05990 [Desulfurococcaceae archaeon]